MPLTRFFDGDAVDLEGLARHLDDLEAPARQAAAQSLSGRQQAMLFEAAAGHRPLSLDDFAAPDLPPLTEVIHHGRNSLPLFRLFQKRFCRPDGETEVLWGYNEQALKAVTGPGYFVVRKADPGEVVIDYREVPPDRPPTWPTIAPNGRGLSRFVYAGMQDFMRGLSRHVSVGRAFRGGKWTDNWFVLCREDRQAD
jgi:hypothetical protein